MNVYVCTDHDGHFVGVCSIVIAPDEDAAKELLKPELREHGLNAEKPFTLRRLNTENPRAFVILDGDY
jgi:hypothetical protein